MGLGIGSSIVRSGGNATVPEDAFIQPPQAWVDNVELTENKFVGMVVSTYGDNFVALESMGITSFSLLTPVALGGDGSTYRTLPAPEASPNGFYLRDNQMPAGAVISFFSEAKQAIQAANSYNYYFSLHGPNMGCPLTGGTVGGWELDLSAYAVGTNDSFQILSIPYFNAESATIDFVDSLDFADSAVYPGDPTSSGYIQIGVQDTPTIAQMLEKVSELFSSVCPNGNFEISGNSLVYEDSIARFWTADGSPGTQVALVFSGTNPTNADIDFLVGQSCHGTFTGPDGINQINF